MIKNTKIYAAILLILGFISSIAHAMDQDLLKGRSIEAYHRRKIRCEEIAKEFSEVKVASIRQWGNTIFVEISLASIDGIDTELLTDNISSRIKREIPFLSESIIQVIIK